VLTQWDHRYGITVSHATADSLAVEFASLPDKSDDLVAEIVDLFPGAADNKQELQAELDKSKKLFLCWD